MSTLSRVAVDGDDDYVHEVAKWESVQILVQCALNSQHESTISEDVISKSYNEHKRDLMRKGYAFDTYPIDRSLFERLDRLVFQFIPANHMPRAVITEARGILDEINKGSRPHRHRFSLLAMMSIKYITPAANMVLLLSHPSAGATDIDLLWELTDHLWCFAHPVYTHMHIGHLDETCDKINTRIREVYQCVTQ